MSKGFEKIVKIVKFCKKKSKIRDVKILKKVLLHLKTIDYPFIIYLREDAVSLEAEETQKFEKKIVKISTSCVFMFRVPKHIALKLVKKVLMSCRRPLSTLISLHFRMV